MLFRKLRVAFCLISLIFCSCSLKTENSEAIKSSDLHRQTLTVFIGAFSNKKYPHWFQVYADEYMKANPKTEIKLIFNVKDYEMTFLDTFSKSGCADMALIPSGVNASLNELSDSGYFLDLTEFIDSDNKFLKSDYFENIFNAVALPGSLTFIPMYFTFSTVVVNRNYTEALGETLPETINLSRMLEAYDRVLSTPGDYDYLYMSPSYGFDTYARGAIDLSGADYKNKTAEIYTAENLDFFKKCLEIVRMPEAESIKLTGALFAPNTNILFDYGTVTYGLAEEALLGYGESAFSIPIQESENSGSISFGSYYNLAISSYSDNTELAWDFLRFCVSERPGEYSAEERMGQSIMHIPINKANFYKKAFYLLEEAYDTQALQNMYPDAGDKGGSIRNAAALLESMAERCNFYSFSGPGVSDILKIEFIALERKSQTAEETLMNIDKKINDLWKRSIQIK